MLAFEAGLLETIFLKGSELQERVSLSEVGDRFRARQKRFYRPLAATLFAKGLLDPARKEAHRNLHRLEWVAYWIALAGIIGAFRAIAIAGLPVFLIPAGFLAGGLVLGRLRQEFTICSEMGQVAADRWRAFAAYLAGTTPTPLSSGEGGEFDSHLAFAAAFGLGLNWAKQLNNRQASDVPDWFRAVGTSHPWESYTNFLAAAAVLEFSSELPGIPHIRETT
jgi:hypothetical protein